MKAARAAQATGIARQDGNQDYTIDRCKRLKQTQGGEKVVLLFGHRRRRRLLDDHFGGRVTPVMQLVAHALH